MEIHVIEASDRKDTASSVSHTEPHMSLPSLRVAAYCRVSTDLEEQETSYEGQISYYAEYILKNPKWKLVGIYADEGISATSMKKRDEFNRMIRDCMNGEIDLIITKSISRFARNTVDCLNVIRKLKERNIGVLFEKENIHTLDAKGEVLITIMASIAQQESQSISQNIRIGIQYQFQQGKVRINHTRFMGYTKNKEGQLIVVPEEAAVIKRIYTQYLNGSSLEKIGRGLEQDGILSPAGKKKWYGTTIRSILTNEKYIGDALLQKYYTVDFLSKRKARNYGILPQYYVENSHEPIISREIFQNVQKEMAERSAQKEAARKYSSAYALSGKICCPKCGGAYRRIKANGLNKTTTWRCRTRLKKASLCSGRILKEADLLSALQAALAQMNESPGYTCYDEKVREAENRLKDYKKEQEILNERFHELKSAMVDDQQIIESHKVAPSDVKVICRSALTITEIQKRQQEVSEEIVSLSENLLSYRNLSSLLKKLREEGNLKDADYGSILEKVTVLPEGLEIYFKTGTRLTVR